MAWRKVPDLSAVERNLPQLLAIRSALRQGNGADPRLHSIAQQLRKEERYLSILFVCQHLDLFKQLFVQYCQNNLALSKMSAMGKLYIAETMPPQELGGLVADQFDNGDAYVHLSGPGLHFHGMPAEERAAYIRAASGTIGELTLTNADQASDVWKLDGTTSPSKARIPYHTDDPYYTHPEGIVGFWNVKSSDDGGENVLLPVSDVLDWASTSLEATELAEQLARPITFTHDGFTATGPILDREKGTARFDRRYVVGHQAVEAVQRFFELIEGDTLKGQSVKLEEGEVLFFDNRAMLHAREPYSNPDRVSYRVRLNRAF